MPILRAGLTVPGRACETAVVLLDRVDSTNAEALRRVRAGERGPLWLAAAEQTAGRGRRGRFWASPRGNLHATLLLVDPSPAAVAPQLAFVAGLAVHDACVTIAPGLDLSLKWPNDMLCGGAKIAGILIEGEGDPVTVAIGIGVNCCHHPSDVDRPATDFAEQGAMVSAAEVLQAVSCTMAARLVQWDRGAGFSAIRAGWLERASGIGTEIRVRLAERETTGHFEAIDEAGRLILRLADGRCERIAAGEVFPVGEASALPGLTPARPGAP